MVAIPLLSSIRATEAGDFAVQYPINLEPTPSETGISNGYLRTAMGAETVATGPGPDRGAIVWNDVLYRVMGAKLVSVSSGYLVTEIGDVGGDGPVALDYGFGRLAINSGAGLFYYDGSTLSQVTDTDLGTVNDMLWIDGYYATTDGTSIVVTDLADPFSVNPLRYGSAEEDPDPIVGLFELRKELYALGTNTIQIFSNVGGTGFPFQANTGATIPVGCVGPRAKVAFVQTLAFVGSARNQGLGVWLAGSGTASKISTRAIDDIIAGEPSPTTIQLEARVSRDESRLYIHLSDKSLVYLASASTRAKQAVWYIAQSGMGEVYRPRNAVLAYGKWICGDVNSGAIGVLKEDIAPTGSADAFFSITRDGETYTQEKVKSLGSYGQRGKRIQWRPHVKFSNYMGLRFRGLNGQPHFGQATQWQFENGLLYNQGNGGILHDVELVGLPGRNGAGWAASEARIEALSA